MGKTIVLSCRIPAWRLLALRAKIGTKPVAQYLAELVERDLDQTEFTGFLGEANGTDADAS